MLTDSLEDDKSNQSFSVLRPEMIEDESNFGHLKIQSAHKLLLYNKTYHLCFSLRAAMLFFPHSKSFFKLRIISSLIYLSCCGPHFEVQRGFISTLP